MTNQEALYELKNNLNVDYGRKLEWQIERLDDAIDMAIKALEAQDKCCIPTDWIYEYCERFNTNKYKEPFSDEALADRQYMRDLTARAVIAEMMMEYQHRRKLDDVL